MTIEALLTTCVIDAKQNRDIITMDIPNAFVQTPLPRSNERIIMIISGKLVELLEEISPEKYSKVIQHRKGSKMKSTLRYDDVII